MKTENLLSQVLAQTKGASEKGVPPQTLDPIIPIGSAPADLTQGVTGNAVQRDKAEPIIPAKVFTVANNNPASMVRELVSLMHGLDSGAVVRETGGIIIGLESEDILHLASDLRLKIIRPPVLGEKYSPSDTLAAEAEYRRNTVQTEAAINLAVGITLYQLGLTSITVSPSELTTFSRDYNVNQEVHEDGSYTISVKERG